MLCKLRKKYTTKNLKEDCQLDRNPLIWSLSSSLNVQTARFLATIIGNSRRKPESRGGARILSLMLFTVRNKNHFQVNSETFHIDTIQHANFHQPSVNITEYQKGAYCLGVKVYNMLPSYIKTESDNPKKFKTVLQNVLYKCSFYSLDEYFQLQKG